MQITGQNPDSSKAHYPFLDIIRVIACFLVILLHVAAMRFDNFYPGWNFALFYNSLARMAVPLFFMLSGFLLLNADISSLRRFYLRRYVRILVPFLTVCVFYYFTPLYRDYGPGQYLEYIYSHYVDYHLWYVYALIGLYLALPFFIRIVSGVDGRKLAWLYVAIWALAYMAGPALAGFGGPPPEILALLKRDPAGAQLFSLADLSATVFSVFNPVFFYGFMGYFLCAWLIRGMREKFAETVYAGALLTFALATIGLILATWGRAAAAGAPDQTYFDNLSPFVCAQALAFFVFCCRFRRENWLIRDLSDKSYWIYLIHIMVLRLVVGFAPIGPGYGDAILIPLWAGIVFVFSYFAALPLRAIERRLLAPRGFR